MCLVCWKAHGRHSTPTHLIELTVSLRKQKLINHKNPSQFTLDRFPQYAKWWWGPDRWHQHFKLCVWVCVVYVWEEKQRCRLSSSLFFSLLPSHTLDLVQNTHVVQDEALGWRREGSFVLSAYWKCTVGFFPAWETIYAKLSPMSRIYLIWLAASASSSGSFSLPAAQSWLFSKVWRLSSPG